MSSITWKWDNCSQSGELGMEFCANQNNEMMKPDNCCRRILGLPLVLSLGVTLVATAVAAIGELIIKGLGNVFGCCCNDDCKLLNGLGMLLIVAGTPIYIALTSPVIATAVAIGIIALPLWAAIHPESLYEMTLDDDN